MKRVLIVEDDPNIVELLRIHLQDLECTVTSANDGQRGLAAAEGTAYDLIILDLMLPIIDGLEVCRRLRMQKIHTPILMLTAKSEEIDKVLGLETGADDYLTKPFSIRELIARVKAIFRRAHLLHEEEKSEPPSLLSFAGLSIDLEKRKVSLEGKRVELSPKEFELLALLAANPGKSYDRQRLLTLVWGYDFDGFEHTVNSHINRLRRKIEPKADEPRYILTTWGVGYRFSEEV
jgi:DNA-binding response OmpR family regulator